MKKVPVLNGACLRTVLLSCSQLTLPLMWNGDYGICVVFKTIMFVSSVLCLSISFVTLLVSAGQTLHHPVLDKLLHLLGCFPIR